MQNVRWFDPLHTENLSGNRWWESHVVIRFLIAVAFTCGLFFCIHIQQVDIESLELDQIAEKFVVAQTDFTFLDQEATNVLRQETLRDVGSIFRFSDRDLRNTQHDVELLITKTDVWREKFPDMSLTQWYLGVEFLNKNLQKIKFTDPRTLRLLEKERFDTSNTFVFTTNQAQEGVTIPAQVWKQMRDKAFENSELSQEMQDALVQLYEKVEWFLDEDVPLERLLKKKIHKSVPDRFSVVNAGDRILDRGERVMPRHLSMIMAMKKQLGQERNLWNPATVVGSLFLASLLTLVSGSYVRCTDSFLFYHNTRLFLLALVVLGCIALSKLTHHWIYSSGSHLIEMMHFPLFVPFGAILVRHLIGARMAMFVVGFVTLFLGIFYTLTPMGMLLNAVASCAALNEARWVRKRKDIFWVCFKAYLVTAYAIIGAHLYDLTFGEPIMFADLLSAWIFLALTSIMVIGLLPLFENLFQLLTDMLLVEYMDPSQPLLKRLSLEAPGTYQHSLVVGILSEAAAQSIGANGLFCRVSCMYHDVGKMVSPQCFTENQGCGLNMHADLTPQESCRLILSHVTDGVELARQHQLPEPFIDIIAQHHGTTLVYYFYNQAIEQAGGDETRVDREAYTYPGPKPQTREAALVMIADSFEAASRALDEVHEESLKDLVDRIVDLKMQERQFDECGLTFKELAVSKKVMVQTLLAAGHARIKYPNMVTKEVKYA